jgi:hypothetical protein
VSTISQTSITTTAVSLVSGGDAPQGSSGGVVFKNIGNETAWLGNSAANATASAGFPLDAGEVVTVDFPYVSSLTVYAATVAGTTTVAVIEP